MDAETPMILTTEGEVATYFRELVNIIHDYKVHYLKIGHYCKRAEHREAMKILSTGNPSAIRVISVIPEALEQVKIVHGGYNGKRRPCTMCPQCGEVTL